MIVEQNGKMYKPSHIYTQLLLLKDLFLKFLYYFMIFTIHFLTALVVIGMICYVIGGAILVIYLLCINEKVGLDTADNKNNYDKNYKWMHEISDVYIIQLVILASLIGFCIFVCLSNILFTKIRKFLFTICYEEIVENNNV